MNKIDFLKKIEKLILQQERYPFLIFLIIGFLLWYSPDYFRPDYFFNPGDSLFAFMPAERFKTLIDIWQTKENEGLGFPLYYNTVVQILYYGMFALLDYIGIPLWIQNRLYFLIPTLILFHAGYKMCLANITKNTNKNIAILGSIYIATCPALTFITPLLQISAAGSIYTLIGLEKLIDKDNKSIGYIVMGITLGLQMPRYLYANILLIIIIFVTLMLKKEIQLSMLQIKKIIKVIIFSALINSITIIPLLLNYESSNSQLLTSEAAYKERTVDVVNFYKETVKISFLMRGIYDTDQSLYHNYFSNPITLLSSYAITIIAVLGYLSSKQNNIKNILIIYIISVFIISLLGSQIYNILTQYIYGFWINNNPQYMLLSVSILLMILMIISYKEISKYIGKRVTFTIYFFIVILNNGIYIFDPKNYEREFSLGNHLNYFVIPEPYKIFSKEFRNNDNHRILIYPETSNGYVIYEWWPYIAMPELLTNITNFQGVGISNYTKDGYRNLQHNIENNNLKELKSELSNNFIQYIMIRKDDINKKTNIEILDKEFEIKYKSKYFDIYKYKNINNNINKNIIVNQKNNHLDINISKLLNSYYYIKIQNIDVEKNININLIQKMDNNWKLYKFVEYSSVEWINYLLNLLITPIINNSLYKENSYDKNQWELRPSVKNDQLIILYVQYYSYIMSLILFIIGLFVIKKNK